MHNLSDTYQQLQAPLLIAAGDSDQTVHTPHQSERLARLKPEAYFMHFRGAGHMIHHSRSEDLVAALMVMVRGEALPRGVQDK